MQVIQNKALRIVDNLTYNSSTKASLKKWKILNIEQLINFELAKLAYCYISKKAPKAVCNMFRANSFQHSYNTRFANNPRIEKHTSKYYNQSFLCKSPSIWMNLNNDLKSKKTLSSFVLSVKKTFLM